MVSCQVDKTSSTDKLPPSEPSVTAPSTSVTDDQVSTTTVPSSQETASVTTTTTPESSYLNDTARTYSQETTDWRLTFIVQDASSGQIILENLSAERLDTDWRFALEVKEGSSWSQIPLQTTLKDGETRDVNEYMLLLGQEEGYTQIQPSDLAHEVPASGKVEFEEHWGSAMSAFEPGRTYRLTKWIRSDEPIHLEFTYEP